MKRIPKPVISPMQLDHQQFGMRFKCVSSASRRDEEQAREAHSHYFLTLHPKISFTVKPLVFSDTDSSLIIWGKLSDCVQLPLEPQRALYIFFSLMQ